MRIRLINEFVHDERREKKEKRREKRDFRDMRKLLLRGAFHKRE